MSDFIDDISALDDDALGEIDMPTDNEPYEDVKASSSKTPPAGRYNLTLPTEITVGAWPAKDGRPGSIELKMDPVVVSNPGGPGDGLEMRFITVSTRRIGGANASSATDLLQRAGITTLPRTPSEWQDVAQQLAGQTIENVYCDWECRVPKGIDDPNTVRDFLKEKKFKVTDKKARKIVLRGMKSFPSDGNGGYVSKITFDDGPGGQPLTLYANLKPTLRGFGFTTEERAKQEQG